MDVLNTESLITHLVLPSSWQSKEGVCNPLYENCFATVQPEIWQFGISDKHYELLFHPHL